MNTSRVQIKNIIRECLEPTLGQPKQNYYQEKYNCPKCDRGNKYNLEINLNESSHRYLLMHCWSCNYSGHISRLLKDYGSKDLWQLVPELKGNSYRRQSNENTISENQIELPEDLIPFYLKDEVKDYLLKERQLEEHILIERKVSYVYSKEHKLFDNIVFPLYDITGKYLEGFVTHNLTTKKYKNHGRMNFVPYLQFINTEYHITLTEGIYDCYSGINAIPLLNTNINKAILEFCFDRNIILALDDEVEDELINKHLHSLGNYGVKNIHLFKSNYKDLNEYNCKDKLGLRRKYLDLFYKFLIINTGK